MMSSPLGSLGSCVCISILFWDIHWGCVGHRLALWWWKKRKTRPARHHRDAQRDHVEVAERAPGPGPLSASPFLSHSLLRLQLARVSVAGLPHGLLLCAEKTEGGPHEEETTQWRSQERMALHAPGRHPLGYYATTPSEAASNAESHPSGYS